MEEASRFGIMNVDEHDQIYEFEEKPAHPKSNLASMGVYLFTWEKLRRVPHRRTRPTRRPATTLARTSSPPCWTQGEKMMRLPLPGLLEGRGHHRPPCGTPTWICSPPPAASISTTPAGPSTPTAPSCPPTFIGANAVLSHCLVTDAAVRYTAPVENSVLFHSVTVEPGASRALLHPHARRRGEGWRRGGIRHRGARTPSVG